MLSPTFPHRLLVGIACAALADWLFFGQPFGISIPIFLVALALAAVALHPIRFPLRAALTLIVALAPIVEGINPLSFVIAFGGTMLCAYVGYEPERHGWRWQLRSVSRACFAGPVRLAADAIAAAAAPRKRLDFGSWVVPSVFMGIFMLLFGAANPLIEHAILDVLHGIDVPSADHVIMWIVALCVAWPFIHLRFRSPAATAVVPGPTPGTTNFDRLFGDAPVLRSLLLFNVLFAVQTVTDATYLWAGVALPHGMTFAEYAHRGAYPLMATALLAGAFVLIAMRQQGPGERSKTVFILIMTWLAQTVLLVLSSIRRLHLYVSVYSLSYMRLAALIWMALVACGLLLIIARILLRKSNRWLVDTNAAMLAVTLYLCCFANFPCIIASYNLARSKDLTGPGNVLDLWYLRSLGPAAIPAIDHAIKSGLRDATTTDVRRELAGRFSGRSTNWRAWTYETWRLRQYLANNPEPIRQ